MGLGRRKGHRNNREPDSAPNLLIISLSAMLVLLAVSNTGSLAKLVNTGPLIGLGEISYSLYLVHRLIHFAASMGLGAVGTQHTAAPCLGSELINFCALTIRS